MRWGGECVDIASALGRHWVGPSLLPAYGSCRPPQPKQAVSVQMHDALITPYMKISDVPVLFGFRIPVGFRDGRQEFQSSNASARISGGCRCGPPSRAIHGGFPQSRMVAWCRLLFISTNISRMVVASSLLSGDYYLLPQLLVLLYYYYYYCYYYHYYYSFCSICSCEQPSRYIVDSR